MTRIRRSPATRRNTQVKERPAGELSNLQWLAAGKMRQGVILLGGSSVVDFRLRVAQSDLRTDLTPSCWSMAGILLDEKTFASVPFTFASASEVPKSNGVETCRLADYEDPRLFPNIAVVEFAEGTAAVRRNIEIITTGQRGIVDLPALMVPWLAYAWGAVQAANPLFQERGVPSAVFVATAYAIAGVELQPGLSAATSCPEAIWQAAIWWQEFFESATGVVDEKRARPVVPHGEFTLRQPAAAIFEPAPPAPARAKRAAPRRPQKRRR